MSYAAAFLGGIIVGFLLGIFFAVWKIKEIIKGDPPEEYTDTERGEVQFIDPVTPQQKFDKAKNIDDILQ